MRHRAHHRRIDQSARGDADEHVRAAHRVGEAAPQAAAVGPCCDLPPVPMDEIVALAKDPLPIDGHDLADPKRFQHPDRRGSRCADAVHHGTHVARRASGQREGIEEASGDDGRRAELIVVHHGDREARLQRLHHGKARRGRNILKVDAAECRLERGDDVAEALHGVHRKAERHAVEARQRLEHRRLALHHRHGGERADVAEPHHRGPVGDERDHVPPCRLLLQRIGMGEEVAHHVPGTRRVGDRHVGEIVDSDLGKDLDLPVPRRIAAERQRAGIEVVRIDNGHRDTSRPTVARAASSPSRTSTSYRVIWPSWDQT